MIVNDNFEGVEKMIEFGATLEPVDVNGKSALHYIMHMSPAKCEQTFKFILSKQHLNGTYDVNE